MRLSILYNMRKYLIFIFLILGIGQKLVAYQIYFEGLVSDEMKEIISSISKLETDMAHPPPPFLLLKKEQKLISKQSSKLSMPLDITKGMFKSIIRVTSPLSR